MIRINLLPVRQVRKVQIGQRQLLLFVGLLAVEGVAMAVLYNMESDEVEKRRQALTAINTEIEALKKEVGDYDQLERQRNELLKQRKVINELGSKRTGPIWLLREMSAVLSINGQPTYDQDEYNELLRRNPGAGFNPKWNPKRLWIERMVERGGRLELSGKAKDYDDVAELLKRLNVSKYFTNVVLKRNDQVKDNQVGLKVVRFALTCKVTYAVKV